MSDAERLQQIHAALMQRGYSPITEEEVERIVEELEQQVALLRERFAGKKSFTLSVDANTPEQ